MTVACPHCGQAFDATADYLRQYGGRAADCAACGRVFTLPAASAGRDEPPGGGAEFEPGVWRDGRWAVVERFARLPPRCFRCNAQAAATVTCVLRWAEPEEHGRAIGRAVAEKAREEQMLVRPSVCPRHARRFRLGRRAGPGVMLAGVAALVAAAVFDVRQIHAGLAGPAALAGLALLFAGFVLRAARFGQLAAVRIDPDRAVVAGFGPAFLDALPPWADARSARAARTAANLTNLVD